MITLGSFSELFDSYRERRLELGAFAIGFVEFARQTAVDSSPRVRRLCPLVMELLDDVAAGRLPEDNFRRALDLLL